TDWRVAAAAAMFCIGLLVTCIETSAQSMPKDVAARTEIYAIPSLTISDQQFLAGDANGKEVTVAGEFRIEAGLAAWNPPHKAGAGQTEPVGGSGVDGHTEMEAIKMS